MSNSVVPFWVAIILIVVAVVGVSFTGLFWWHSSRRPGARGSSGNDNAEAGARLPASYERPAPRERYHIPTLVFQHHEPETHGYFAPLYLDPATSGRAGGGGHGGDGELDPELKEQAKMAVRGYYSDVSDGSSAATGSTTTSKEFEESAVRGGGGFVRAPPPVASKGTPPGMI
jgi:hypothetical protein